MFFFFHRDCVEAAIFRAANDADYAAGADIQRENGICVLFLGHGVSPSSVSLRFPGPLIWQSRANPWGPSGFVGNQFLSIVLKKPRH